MHAMHTVIDADISLSLSISLVYFTIQSDIHCSGIRFSFSRHCRGGGGGGYNLLSGIFLFRLHPDEQKCIIIS